MKWLLSKMFYVIHHFLKNKLRKYMQLNFQRYYNVKSHWDKRCKWLWIKMIFGNVTVLEEIHTVSFIWIWLIFILNSLCLKSSLKISLSPSSTSFPFGALFNTRALPQAKDCNVRFNSLSSTRESKTYLMKLWIYILHLT